MQESSKSEPNPVMVREVRQLVRNRGIIVMIQLYVLVMVVSCFATIIQNGNGWDETSGQRLFSLLITIAVCSALFCVLLYTAIRLIYDRAVQDQMYYSALRPYQIMIGKILAGAAITLILLSSTIPFVTVAYLLRGVDILTVVSIYLFFFIFIQQLNVVTLAFCAGIRSILQGIGHGLLLIVYLFFSISMTLVITFAVLEFGNFSGSGMGWIFMFMGNLAGMIPTVIAFYVGVAQLNPGSFNSMFVVRILITILGGITLFFCTLAFALGSEYSYYGWLVFMVIGLGMLFMVGVCERETWESRIRDKIPTDNFPRMLSFCFYSGSPNAMLWGIGWILLAIFAGILGRFGYSLNPSANNLDSWFVDGVLGLLAAIILVYAYCMSSILLRNRFFQKWVPKEATWMIVVGLFILLSGGGIFTMFLLGAGSSSSKDTLEFLYFLTNLPNPVGAMGLFDWSDKGTLMDWFSALQLFFAIIWAFSVTYMAVPWFKECYERFIPLEKDDLWTYVRTEMMEPEQPLPVPGETPVVEAAVVVEAEIVETAEIVAPLPTLGAFYSEEED